jgi:hypothetical protein
MGAFKKDSFVDGLYIYVVAMTGRDLPVIEGAFTQ